jgi:5-methylcytosine-specific restriction protein A
MGRVPNKVRTPNRFGTFTKPDYGRSTKRKDIKKIRKLTLVRDNYICQHCKECYSEENLECDHIIPLHRGGEDSIDNTQTLCVKCHKIKSDSERNPNNGSGTI